MSCSRYGQLSTSLEHKLLISRTALNEIQERLAGLHTRGDHPFVCLASVTELFRGWLHIEEDLYSIATFHLQAIGWPVEKEDFRTWALFAAAVRTSNVRVLRVKPRAYVPAVSEVSMPVFLQNEAADRSVPKGASIRRSKFVFSLAISVLIICGSLAQTPFSPHPAATSARRPQGGSGTMSADCWQAFHDASHDIP